MEGCAFGAGVWFDAPLPPGLKEASGVSASGEHPGRLYSVDDGGTLYSLDANNNSGAVLGLYRLRGAGDGSGEQLEDDEKNKRRTTRKQEKNDWDWEDVAVVRDPLSPRRWKVFVGDIGNNEGLRRTVRVFRFEEPLAAAPNGEGEGEGGEREDAVAFIDVFDTIRLEYPEDAREAGEDGAEPGGGWPDAETLIVDPRRGDIFIITKETQGEAKARVYRAGYPYSVQNENALEFVGRLGVSGVIVGGDVTQTGDELLLKTLAEVLYFRRGDRRITSQPYVREAQGEAVGFAMDGSGYYTLSERRQRKRNGSASQRPDALTFYPRRHQGGGVPGGGVPGDASETDGN